MYELMHASLKRLERENQREVARELRHRRVWLWVVPARHTRQGEVSPKSEEAAKDESSGSLTRTQALINLIRLSIE